MKTTIQIELQPFQIPEFVYTVPKIGLKQDGIGMVPKFTLGELDVETLGRLCDDFRDRVLKEAQKVYR